MSDSITDTTGQPLLFANLRLDAEAESSVIVARIPCRAGRYLTASGDARAGVLARRTGSEDDFVGLSTDPISLTEFDGEVIDFDFKVSAGSVTGLERVALPVRVTFNP